MATVWEGIHFKAVHEQVEVSPGNTKTFEYVWRRDGTRTIVLDGQRILLTHEYRHELQDYDWRLPGGKLDYADEPVVEAAARELREETGIIARTWRYLWATTPDATVRFKRHFLSATDINVGTQDLSEGEQISIQWFSLEEAWKMALSGMIREEISALSILRFIQKLQLPRGEITDE